MSYCGRNYVRILIVNNMVNEDEKLKLIASYIRFKTCFLLHRNFGNIKYIL